MVTVSPADRLSHPFRSIDFDSDCPAREGTGCWNFSHHDDNWSRAAFMPCAAWATPATALNQSIPNLN
jgi:hypothetical protein